ncbi:MAG: hypothetical protein AAGL49_15750, partial [Pseudomonadota bacterium]
LLSDILLIGGDPPNASEDDRKTMGADRALALVRAGRIGAAQRLFVMAGQSDVASQAQFAAAAALADLAAGEDRIACLRGADLAQGRDSPIWLRLRALCYALAKEPKAAQLTLDLLRDQGELTRADDTLIAFVEGRDLAETPIRSAIDLAGIHASQSPITAANLREADSGVLFAVANGGAAEL